MLTAAVLGLLAGGQLLWRWQLRRRVPEDTFRYWAGVYGGITVGDILLALFFLVPGILILSGEISDATWRGWVDVGLGAIFGALVAFPIRQRRFHRHVSDRLGEEPSDQIFVGRVPRRARICHLLARNTALVVVQRGQGSQPIIWSADYEGLTAEKTGSQRLVIKGGAETLELAMFENRIDTIQELIRARGGVGRTPELRSD